MDKIFWEYLQMAVSNNTLAGILLGTLSFGFFGLVELVNFALLSGYSSLLETNKVWVKHITHSFFLRQNIPGLYEYVFLLPLPDNLIFLI